MRQEEVKNKETCAHTVKHTGYLYECVYLMGFDISFQLRCSPACSLFRTQCLWLGGDVARWPLYSFSAEMVFWWLVQILRMENDKMEEACLGSYKALGWWTLHLNFNPDCALNAPVHLFLFFSLFLLFFFSIYLFFFPIHSSSFFLSSPSRRDRFQAVVDAVSQTDINISNSVLRCLVVWFIVRARPELALANVI